MIEKFAALDFETANWQPTSVCSVGIVLVNRGNIEDRFYSLIHPVPDFYSRRNPDAAWAFVRYLIPAGILKFMD